MHTTKSIDETNEFSSTFHEELLTINPEYSKNSLIRGIRCEFTREVYPSVYASHNSICRKGTYYHGFCITLHKMLPANYLISPFSIGGRFDHNFDVNMAFQKNLLWRPGGKKKPRYLNSSHNFRKGADKIIEKCCSAAEDYLLPHYIEVYKKSRKSIVELLSFFETYTGSLEIGNTSHGVGYTTNQDLDMKQLRKNMPILKPAKLSYLEEVIKSKPELFKLIREKLVIDYDSIRKNP